MADAHIRAVHCSPDAPTLTVSVGDTTRRVSYGEATDYVTVPSGTTEVTIDPTDGDEQVRDSDGRHDSGAAPNASARATPTVETDHSQTVLIVGFARQNSLETITLEDESGGIRSQYAKLRFVNAVPDAPALDFRFADPVVDGNEVLSRKIAFGENGTYRTIDAGTRQFDFGIDARDGYRQVLTAEKAFESGRTYTAIALGQDESGEYDVLLLEDAPVETPIK